MGSTTDTTAIVRRHRHDPRQATYRLDDIAGLHMDGGDQPELRGYVWCDMMLAGDLMHVCARSEGAHRIKVCIRQEDNSRHTYDGLTKRIREDA